MFAGYAGRQRGRRGLRICVSVLAVLLAGLFLYAVGHELIFHLLGHDHDAEDCALCCLVHTPVVLAFFGVLGLLPVVARPPLPALAEVPCRPLAFLRPDPRGPPARSS